MPVFNIVSATRGGSGRCPCRPHPGLVGAVDV